MKENNLKKENIDKRKINNPLSTWALIFGILSPFFFSIGIIPLLALIMGIIGITKSGKLENKGRTKSTIAVILGAVYTLVLISV